MNWTCGTCRNPKPKSESVQPVPIPRTESTKDNPDDDDDVVELVQPPVKRQESQKPTVSAIPRFHSKEFTSAKAPQLVRIIDDPVDFLWSQPSVKRSSSSTTALSSGIGHLSVSDNKGDKEPKRDHHPEPSQPTNPELHGPPASPPSHESQLQKTKGQEISLSSFTARSRSVSRDRPSITPTTATRSGTPSLNNQGFLERSRANSGTNQLSFLERWSMTTLPRSVKVLNPSSTRDIAQKAPLFHPALLPHHVNAQYRSGTTDGESAKKSDAWYLLALGKSKSKSKSASSSTVEASDPSHSTFRSRKRTSSRYQANVRPPNVEVHAASKVPFYFNVTAWMKEKEDALTLFEANL